MPHPSVKTVFFLHFFVSLLIFLLLVAMLATVWFPGELFFMDGGWQGLKIIAPIDLILGPALTLLLYRPGKKGVAFDLSAIFLIQISALGFGVYQAYHQRTSAIVFAENRFETISYQEFNSAKKHIEDKNLTPKSVKEFGSMPITVYAEPFVADNYGQYLEDILNGLPELRERSDRYTTLIGASDSLEEFRIDTPVNGTTIEVPATSKTADNEPDDNITFTLKARYHDGTITFNRNDFQLIDIERDKD